MARPNLNDIFRTQSGRLDAALERLGHGLDHISDSVRRDLLNYLSGLSTTGGLIESNAQNLLILNNAGLFALRSAYRNGYENIVGGYLREYGAEITTVQQVFERIGVPFDWTAEDRDLAAMLINRDRDQLLSVADEMAARIAQRARIAAGAATFADLTETVERSLDVSGAQALTFAETGTGQFFAQINGRKNEEAGIEKFYYAGPNDKLTRPFCRHLIAEGRIFTRAEIRKMDNKNLAGDVFIVRGGWRCRHQWVGIPDSEPERA